MSLKGHNNRVVVAQLPPYSGTLNACIFQMTEVALVQEDCIAVIRRQGILVPPQSLWKILVRMHDLPGIQQPKLLTESSQDLDLARRVLQCFIRMPYCCGDIEVTRYYKSLPIPAL